MRIKSFLVAALVLGATPATTAPFAIVLMEPDALQLVDLGTLTKTGSIARYESTLMMRDGPTNADGVIERIIHRKEVDCEGRRVRLTDLFVAVKGGKPVPSPWASVFGGWAKPEPEELRLACSGQVGSLQVIPALDVGRVILNPDPDRPAD